MYLYPFFLGFFSAPHSPLPCFGSWAGLRSRLNNSCWSSKRRTPPRWHPTSCSFFRSAPFLPDREEEVAPFLQEKEPVGDDKKLSQERGGPQALTLFLLAGLPRCSLDPYPCRLLSWLPTKEAFSSLCFSFSSSFAPRLPVALCPCPFLLEGS